MYEVAIVWQDTFDGKGIGESTEGNAVVRG